MQQQQHHHHHHRIRLSTLYPKTPPEGRTYPLHKVLLQLRRGSVDDHIDRSRSAKLAAYIISEARPQIRLFLFLRHVSGRAAAVRARSAFIPNPTPPLLGGGVPIECSQLWATPSKGVRRPARVVSARGAASVMIFFRSSFAFLHLGIVDIEIDLYRKWDFRKIQSVPQLQVFFPIARTSIDHFTF